MDDARVINTCNINNDYIAYIKAKHCQIMATITYKILKFEPIIKKKKIVTNSTFFTVINFSTSFLHLSQFHYNTAFIKPIHQKLIFINLKKNATKIIYHFLFFKGAL